MALYVDERADEAQNQALRGIFSGQAGGHIANLGPLISEVLGASSAAISINASAGSFPLSVDGLGSAEAQAIEGQGGGAVTVVGHDDGNDATGCYAHGSHLISLNRHKQQTGRAWVFVAAYFTLWGAFSAGVIEKLHPAGERVGKLLGGVLIILELLQVTTLIMI